MESQKSLPVQFTNDDSIVSKRSASRFGYISDEFLRPFVNKSPRRSALINRGYYIRIKMVRDTLSKFLSIPSDQPKQIISLGAGFDTTYWCLKSQKVLKERDRYIEIDFSQVVERKINIIKQHDILHSLLGIPIELDDKRLEMLKEKKLSLDHLKKELEVLKAEKNHGSKIKEKKEQIKKLEKEIEDVDDGIHTNDYILIKGDLRNLDSIKSSLISKKIDFSIPTLVMTECVLNYMPSSEADHVIAWVCKEFENVVYFSYDQIHPNDAFGNMMCTSLKNRNSPLLGIHPYYSTRTQYLRYKNLGFKYAFSIDVLSCYENCLDDQEKERIDLLEDFDEHEEWIIKCQHYSFTIGSNSIDYFNSIKSIYKINDNFLNEEDNINGDSKSILQDSYWKLIEEDKSHRLLLRWGHTSFKICDDKILIFGGYGGDTKQFRNNTSLILDTKTMIVNDISNMGDIPSARLYHTSTVYKSINNVTYAVIFGGRGSPKSSYNDFYSLKVHDTPIFKKIDVKGDIPSPRWRHTSELIQIDNDKKYILIFGGRSSTSKKSEFVALNDLYSIDIETWNSVKIESYGDIPSPRFSHTSISINNGDKMLVFGGYDGRKAFNDVNIFDFKTKTWEKIECNGTVPNPMFSHTATHVYFNNKEYMIVLGGCTLKKTNNTSNCYIFDIEERTWSILNTIINIDPKDMLLINHTATLVNNNIITIGGGALCFSFGSFFNKLTILNLLKNEESIPAKEAKKLDTKAHVNDKEYIVTSNNIKQIPLKVVHSITEHELLNEIFPQQLPVIIKGLNFGECVHKWKSKEYFYNKIDSNKLISTRKCKSKSLDFINKNFDFVTMKSNEFFHKIFDNDDEYRYYFRSVGENARKERSDFWKSFPEIKDDFVIPEVLNPLIKDRIFLSALRISSKDSQLWTHYDICDNFLFQIVGKKKVVLWSPDDIDYLYVEDSSSLVIDIESPDLKRFPKFVNGTQYVGLLEPGDTLFIPALWFHNVTSLDPSIAINVFWKKLDDSYYNSKDLYGNKMLVPVETIFEKLEKIKPLISSIPQPYKKFYGKQIIKKIESYLDLN